MPDTKSAYIVIFLLLAGLAVRIAFAAHAYASPGWYFADDYEVLALSLLDRGEYANLPGIPSLSQSPGYPLWIAFVYAMFGKSRFVLLVFNAFLSVVTNVLIFLIARRLFSLRTAMLSLLAATAYPFAIYYCGYSCRETFMICVFTLLMFFLTGLYRELKSSCAAVSGILAALLALTNPSCMFFAAAAPFGLFLKYGFRPLRRTAFPVCLYLIMFLTAYSPWVIRNYSVFGRLLLTNLHGGINLYQPLIVPPDKFATPDELKIYAEDPVSVAAEHLILESRHLEAYDMYMEASRKLILLDPGKYFKDVLYRIIKYWRPVPYKRSYNVDYAKVFWASLLSDGIIIPFALFGIFITRRRWREFIPAYLALLLWPLAYYLVYVVVRFRLPVMMIMIIFAAAAAERLIFKNQPPGGEKTHV